MDTLYKSFLTALKDHDKERTMNICKTSLKNKTSNIESLYQEILAKSLNNIVEEFEDENMLIWQEHVRSSIILSIIENCYKYVLEEKDLLKLKKKDKVIVLCPKYEDHIIGARMAADIFTIAGYETIFIGANTPWKAILKAIESIKPDIISISVTNFYNVIEARKTIDIIKEEFDYGIKFILGGDAFKGSEDVSKQIGGDRYLEKLGDIFSIELEVKNK